MCDEFFHCTNCICPEIKKTIELLQKQRNLILEDPGGRLGEILPPKILTIGPTSG